MILNSGLPVDRHILQVGTEKLLQTMSTVYHSEPEWNIGNKNCLTWNIAQTYDFCIPLDFLDTKDLKKTSKGQKKIWRPNPKSKPKISKFYNFFSWYGSYGVILVGKAINLSLKAIKTLGGPDIGQLSKVRRRMCINVISLFQC